jgi:hypothetical protein
MQRLAVLGATLGLLSSAIVAATSTGTADAAATPSCNTLVSGILPSGRLIERAVHNTRMTDEKRTSGALPYKVDYMYGYDYQKVYGGYVHHYIAHTAGQPARAFLIKEVTGSPSLGLMSQGHYQLSPKGRLFADSGRYYTYGVDPSGNLMRWTRFTDNRHDLWFGSAKRVKSGMGGLRTLSFMFTWVSSAGRKDVLYGTTKSGALVQFQIPWSTPAKPKLTTVKKTGFSSYTGLSLSWCNASGTLGSFIAIDKTHNQARWYTLAGQMSPKAANLVRHPLVAPGTNWRLHATF